MIYFYKYLRNQKIIILCICFGIMQISCGVLIGTTVDAIQNTATYPFKEYLFWGAYKYDNTWDEPYQIIEQEKEDYGEQLIGIAVSGGGSRSAYFFASVMNEFSKIKLNDAPLVDEIDYISSVSGGSLAAAHYCLSRYKSKKSIQNPKFFQQFKRSMSCNFQLQALGKLAIGFWLVDFFTYYNRGDLFAGIWEDNFWGNATFSDLVKTEKNGAPKLIINGTDLSGGHKFVFSTIKDEEFNNSEYFTRLRNAGFINYATSKGHIAFKTIGFQTLNSDIRPYRVAKAVVASASVPNLLGPVTLRDYRKKKRYLNISDGGIYDNYGIESLMQIFTTYLDKHPGKKAKIILIDGSGYFDIDKRESGDLNLAYYSERPLAVSWLRSKSYMEYVFKKANDFKNAKGEKPYANLTYEVISLYDVLPSQEKVKEITGEKAIDSILQADKTALDFFKKISTIQTNFAISNADAKSIDKVSAKIVAKFKESQK